MKLNPDCIRDILITVEEEITGIDVLITYPYKVKFERLEKYPVNEVLYHMKYCEASGLVDVSSWLMDTGCVISDLTPFGHQFLSDIRSDNNWNKIKEIASKVGSTSLDALTQIASSVISGLIRSQFGLI